MNVSRLSTTEILSLPLNEMANGLSLGSLASEIKQLHRELATKGLKFRPHIWISDDWFCPDGHTGFAIPFYILHPRLIAMMKQSHLTVEGYSPRQRMQILRHETGHALDNAYYLRRNKQRQRIFGLSSTPYPKSYEPQAYSKQYVRHLSPNYAQAHPDEDWAETFAVYLDPDSRWQSRYTSGVVYNKLSCVESLIGTLRDRQPCKTNHQELEPISLDTRTFAGWIREQQKQRQPKGPTEIDRALRRIFAENQAKIVSRLPAASFVQRVRPDLIQQVAAHTGRRQYEVSFLVQNLQHRINALDLSLKNSEEECFSALCRHLKANSLAYIKGGFHRIIM